jgi:SAM-dependent methyltransferase
MIDEAFRRARTAAYRLAGPADRIWRKASGKASLPPLWLRRHTGAVGRFESAALETAQFLERLELPRPGDLVLDVGCGAGAMVPEFARRLGPEGRYVGFDVHAPSIEWCRRHWSADLRLSFVLAAVASAYGSPSGPPAASYRFPVADASADLVLAKSLFTHLLVPEASHYLAEIRRVLRPGRPAVVTAFLFEPDGPGGAAARRAFPVAGPEGRLRYRSRRRPTAAVAYDKARFVEMVEAAGLRLQWLSPGFYPGGERLTGQDTLLLGL